MKRWRQSTENSNGPKMSPVVCKMSSQTAGFTHKIRYDSFLLAGGELEEEREIKRAGVWRQCIKPNQKYPGIIRFPYFFSVETISYYNREIRESESVGDENREGEFCL